MRLDQYLVHHFPDFSRTLIRKAIDAGSVVVNGQPSKASHKLRTGDVLRIFLPRPPREQPTPEDIPLEVLYEDEYLALVNKPADMVVHPAKGNWSGTLVNALAFHFSELSKAGGEYRPGIVHRLDRDTSGLLVAARSPRAYDALVAELSEHAVERSYIALVWGHLASPRGVIDAPIGRSAARRTRMAVRDAGKPARTEYAVREEFDRPVCTLLDCQLETGRTHQIRVHLAAIGHPVVGDGTYGGARDSLVLDRPFLHAASLAFDHPVTREHLQFEEPLPPELQAVLDRLRSVA